MKQTHEKSEPVLIRCYGEFWNPALVDWNRTWKLLGYDKRRQEVNAYEQRGIYVLYRDYVPVYIGKADQSSIGYRLQLHRLSQRKGPRWDRFSWFGLNRFNASGDPGKIATNVHVKTSELIATLEALSILIADPRLNSRREKLKNAVRIEQSASGKPASQLEETLSSIEQKLDSMIAANAE
jgi:hypothetical protein